MSDDSSPSGPLLALGLLYCAGMVAIGGTTALHIADYSGVDLGGAVAAAAVLFVCSIGGIAGFALITGSRVDGEEVAESMPFLEASSGAPTCADCQATMWKRDGRWRCPNPWCGRGEEEVSEA